MNCPTCTVELRVADRQGVEIDYCPQCRGVWLDRGELDKIIERSNVTFEPAGRRRDDDDDDDYKYREGYGKPQGHAHKRKGFLGELFDFD
jgi:Zn-finger nucleic acid-binding protein